MRLAEARLAASTMISCSMIESLIDIASDVAVGLDDEDVGAPDRLAEAAVQLAVGELGQVGVAERRPRGGRRSPRPEAGWPSGHQVQALLGDELPSRSYSPVRVRQAPVSSVGVAV